MGILAVVKNESGENSSLSWWPLVGILGATVVVILGVRAWSTGHDVGFAILVLAAVVGVGLERVRVSIRERG